MYDEKLADLDVSILCNNVGAASIGDFVKMKPEDVHQMLSCNLYPVTLLTKNVIKGFKKRY